jgi:hypothetical protein
MIVQIVYVIFTSSGLYKKLCCKFMSGLELENDACLLRWKRT